MMIPLLQGPKRICNVDESWLGYCRYVRKMWVPADAAATVTDKQVQPRISLIAALDTDGKIWCALTQANTDSDVMTMFLQHLCREFDREDPLWRTKVIIQLDNAAWHKNPVMMRRLAAM